MKDPDGSQKVLRLIYANSPTQLHEVNVFLQKCKDYGFELGNKQKMIASQSVIGRSAQQERGMMENYFKVLDSIRNGRKCILLIALCHNSLLLLRDMGSKHGISAINELSSKIDKFINYFEAEIKTADATFKTDILNEVDEAHLSFATCHDTNWDFKFQHDKREPLAVTQIKRMTNYLGQEITALGNLTKIIHQLRDKKVFLDESNYAVQKDRTPINKKIKGYVILCDLHYMTKPFAINICRELSQMMTIGDRCRFIHGVGKNSVEKGSCKLKEIKELLFIKNTFKIMSPMLLDDGTKLGEFTVLKTC